MSKVKEEKVYFENTKAIGETKMALKVKLEDRIEPIWVPKSIIHDDSEVWINGHSGQLVLPEWFCIKEGLV